MISLLDSSSYLSTVRAAQDLADLLKRVRPATRDQTEELQCIVTRAHQRLDVLSHPPENAALINEHCAISYFIAREAEITDALTDLEAAHQALRDLRHAATAKGCEQASAKFKA